MAQTGAGVETGNGSMGDPGRSLPAGQSFEVDRLAKEWYAGEPLGVGESVAQVIGRFSPRSVPPEQWARIEGLVRESVRRSAPISEHTAGSLMTVVARLAVWADTLGQSLAPEAVFHPDTVDRFVTEGCADLAPGTRNNYRRQLRFVGMALLGPSVYPPPNLRLPKPDPQAPYSASEVVALRSWGRGLPTERYCHNVGVILALGLGAGLHSQEVSRLVGDDITVDDAGVVVHVIGERERTVPVLARYEEEIASIEREAGGGPVFLPERVGIRRKQVPNFVARCPKGDAPALNTNRLRNTWIVAHLSAGTHLLTLAEAAGVEPNQIVRYTGYATAPASDESRRMLREPSGP